MAANPIGPQPLFLAAHATPSVNCTRIPRVLSHFIQSSPCVLVSHPAYTNCTELYSRQRVSAEAIVNRATERGGARKAACYSALSAFMGEIDAARLAGMMAAKNAQMASALAATVSAKGSQLETP